MTSTAGRARDFLRIVERNPDLVFIIDHMNLSDETAKAGRICVKAIQRPVRTRHSAVRILSAQPASPVSVGSYPGVRTRDNSAGLGPITQSLDAQMGANLVTNRQIWAPVSARAFSISVFDTRRPVRELAETGSCLASLLLGP